MIYMSRLTASQLREDMATAINQVAFGGERIVLQQNTRDVAAPVPMEDLILLKALAGQDGCGGNKESALGLKFLLANLFHYFYKSSNVPLLLLN